MWESAKNEVLVRAGPVLTDSIARCNSDLRSSLFLQLQHLLYILFILFHHLLFIQYMCVSMVLELWPTGHSQHASSFNPIPRSNTDAERYSPVLLSINLFFYLFLSFKKKKHFISCIFFKDILRYLLDIYYFFYFSK